MKLGIRIFLICQIVFSTKRGTVSHKRNMWNREAVLRSVVWQETKSKKCIYPLGVHPKGPKGLGLVCLAKMQLEVYLIIYKIFINSELHSKNLSQNKPLAKVSM